MSTPEAAPHVYFDEDKQAALEGKFERLTPQRVVLAGLLYAIERDDCSDGRAVAARMDDPAPIYIELATHLAENPEHARRLVECLAGLAGAEVRS